MARDLSCPSGRKAYKTKREAMAATLAVVKRCERCRWWHAAEPTRRGGGTRK